MKKYYITTLATMVIISALTGCASQDLKAPCPEYGSHCTKKPVNSWDTTRI